jgi:ATP-binding cassette subfamily C protein CydC
MSPIWHIVRLMLAADRRAMARGAVLSVTVLLMGAALLGLSGWFITATGLAGLAGVGIAFDVFRPSAGVRFLALGRTAARYGERVLTHDATLRALAGLRVVLLRGYARGDGRALVRLRGESALTRIAADVDALDGLVLRLVLPAAAALVTHVVVFAALAWLVGWPVAGAVALGYLPAASVILLWLARRGMIPSARAEETGQALRRGVIDMIRDRDALILASRMQRQETGLITLDKRARMAMRLLDRAERAAGVGVSVTGAMAAMAALVAGAVALQLGKVDAAMAVTGFFVALALAETLLPLRRGAADLGRMAGAAARVAPFTTMAMPEPTGQPVPDAPLLRLDHAGVRASFGQGETVALVGPSGAGKSTLLLRIAGLDDDTGILIRGLAPRSWPEARLRDVITMLPQRSALIAGTVGDNLSLAGDITEAAMRDALDAVSLADDIVARGGVQARLGEAGAGLSGGQARRLTLARSILKSPDILLLDEPTEGLDAATARAVLYGVRRALPHALIIVAMHRGVDHPVFDRVIELAP